MAFSELKSDSAGNQALISPSLKDEWWELIVKEGFSALFDRYGENYKWFATTTVMIGALSMALSATIINVALPSIMDDFNITQDQVKWLAAGYFAAVCTTMLANSWAVEALGLRATFMGAMTIFMMASVLGGFAPDKNILILSRVAQGAMAGIIQPLSMIIIFNVFPHNERGKGIGIFGLGVVLAPAFGPVIGGALIDIFSWRAVFFFALPFCTLGLIMSLIFLPSRRQQEQCPKFDWIGFVLLVIAVGSLMWTISNGYRLGWRSGSLLGIAGVGIATATGFILRQRRLTQPMLDMSIYASRNFAYGSVLSFVLGIALFGTTYLIPLFVQQIQGLTASSTGLLLMPAGFVMAALLPFTGRLCDRISVYKPIIFGLLVIASSCFLMQRAEISTNFFILALWIAIGRGGIALLMPAINTGALTSLEIAKVTRGAGPLNFARMLGAAFGINILSITLDQRTESHTNLIQERLIEERAQLSYLTDGSEVLPVEIFAFDKLPVFDFSEVINQTIHVQAYTLAFHDAFTLLGIIFVIAIIPAWLMKKHVKPPIQ